MLKSLFNSFFKKHVGNFAENPQKQSTSGVAGVNLTNNPVSPICNTVVVGVYYHQDTLKRICNERAELFTQAQIILDDNNQYDGAAVRIEIDGDIVGYLDSTRARIWRSMMISKGISGAQTCTAKIVWDTRVVEKGSYGVWLDIKLWLEDSVPEKSAIVRRPFSDDNSTHFEFLVGSLNRYELSFCSVGDRVKLWVAKDAETIYIYRKGADPGGGKIGVCYNYYDEIKTAAVREARIESIYEGGCRISATLFSKKQVKAMKRKEIQDKQRGKLDAELSKKYTPRGSIKIRINIMEKKMIFGNEILYLDIKHKEHYLLNPKNLVIDVLNQEKNIVGELRQETIVKRILKAHYNRYAFDVKVLYVYDDSYPSAEIVIIPKKEKAEGRP